VSFGGEEHLVVILGDGSTMMVPRVWTDADGHTDETISKDETVFSADALRSLVRVVDGLLQRN
jgi:hypothetical protein